MRAFLFGALSLLAAGACGAAEPPKRVAVAGSGLTEIVYALGAGDRLVGVDATSLFPSRARGLPQLGYLRALGAEGILSLKPDLLIAADEAGPPAVLAQLGSAGLPVLRARDGYDIEAIVARIASVGAALGKEDAAAGLALAVRDDLARVRAAIPSGAGQPRVLFLLSAGSGPPLVSGRDTAAAAMMALAGGVNAVDAYRGYKPLSGEGLAMAAPDIVLTTDQTVAALGGAGAVGDLPAFAGLPRKPRLIAFDAVYLFGFGPRTAHAARDLAAALHPSVRFPELPAHPWLADAP